MKQEETSTSTISPKRTVLYLSKDYKLDIKLLPTLAAETQLQTIRSHRAASALIELKSYDILIVDEDIYTQINKDIDFKVQLIFEDYRKAMLKNSGITFLILADSKVLNFKTSLQSEGTVLFLDKQTLDAHQLTFLIRSLRKRYFKTILEKDLIVGKNYNADFHHYLPLNNKYFPFLRAGETYSASKKTTLLKSNIYHLYVNREQVLNLFDQPNGIPSPFVLSESLHMIRKKYRLFLGQFFGGPLEHPPLTGHQIYELGLEIVIMIEKLLNKFTNPYEALCEVPFPRWSGLSHGINCAVYALLWGKYCFPNRTYDIAWAALIHNLGLSYLPKSIVDQSEKLLSVEDKLMYEQHPAWTLKLLQKRNVPLKDSVSVMIADHHEHYDGTGFPQGKSSFQIMLDASFLSLIGSYDYAKTIRPGQKAINPQKAWEDLKHYHLHSTPLGKKFHPDLMIKIDSFFKS